MIGGRGRDGVRDFYADRFVSQFPPDIEIVPVSRTAGQGVVDELITRPPHLVRHHAGRAHADAPAQPRCRRSLHYHRSPRPAVHRAAAALSAGAEIFEVLAGSFRFHCAGDEFDVAPGTTVVVPRSAVHGWVNLGLGPARLLFTFVPGGIDKLVVAI